MKLKSKLFSVCIALILTIGLLVVGVMAATSATVNFNGSVSFVADDVHARVNGEILGTYETGEAIELDELNFSAYDYPTEALKSWENTKDFTFADKNSTIKLDVVIENLSPERPLYVNITGSVGTKDNVTQVVKHNGNQYTVGDIIKLDPKIGEEPVATSFSIELNIKNKNIAVNKVDFSYVIELNNYDTSSATKKQYSVNCEFLSDINMFSALMKVTDQAPFKYKITSDGFAYAYVETGSYDITSKLDEGTQLEIKIYLSTMSVVEYLKVDGTDISDVYDLDESGMNYVYTINKTLASDLNISVCGLLEPVEML